MAKNTKGEFEEYLNELGTPDDDLKSLGGRIPDNSKYGSWLRRNDVIAFQVGYNGWCLDASEDCSHNNLIRKVYAHVSNDGQSHTDDRYRKFNDFFAWFSNEEVGEKGFPICRIALMHENVIEVIYHEEDAKYDVLAQEKIKEGISLLIKEFKLLNVEIINKIQAHEVYN